MHGSDFITAVEDALAKGVKVQGMELVVDSQEKEAAPQLSFLSIKFHLQGPAACAANFTYTFTSDMTVEENLADLAKFVGQQNVLASKPPEAAAGAD